MPSDCRRSVLAILRAGGVPDELAVAELPPSDLAVNGFTMDEAGYAERRRRAPRTTEEAGRWSAATRLAAAEQFANLKEVGDHFAITDQDARFELLLDLFVDGLAARAASAS